MINFDLYYQALNADHHFQNLLNEKFGKQSAEFRYQSKPYNDAALDKAVEVKRTADAAWLCEMRKVSL